MKYNPLEEMEDNSEIKESLYYPLIKLNKDTDNSDKIIIAAVEHPQELKIGDFFELFL